MKKTALIFIVLVAIASCQPKGPSQQEYDELKNQLETCQNENAELKNTPANRLLKAQKLETEGNLSQAESEYRELLEKFPKTDEAKQAQVFIDKVEKEREQKRLEEERKKQLGFKALNEKTIIEQGDCKLTFSGIQLANRWIFDRYGNEWRYIEAERGDKYLTFTLSVTSKSKNPNLPPIYVYQLINGELQYVSTAYYKFYRWDDYASYLGNNADYNNDFARTETIRFSPGAVITMSDYNENATFLMVKKTNCVYRSENRYDNPPVSYSNTSCNYDRTLNLDQADSEYFTIKIFNKDKI